MMSKRFINDTWRCRVGMACLVLSIASGCRSPARSSADGAPVSSGSVSSGSVSQAAGGGAGCIHHLPHKNAPTALTELAGFHFEVAGSHWRGTLPAGEGIDSRRHQLTFAVLADTREALPATLARLDALHAVFEREHVDAVVLLGGIDATFEGTRAVLRRLLGPWTLIAMPGDRISREGFAAAMRELDKRAIDATLAPVIALPSLVLINVPGYFLTRHLMADTQGCSYDAVDVDRLVKAAGEAGKPRLLFSYGPPLGHGAAAVDRGMGELSYGDPQLSRLISRAGIHFGVFGHISEASGHATTVDGQAVEPGRWTSSLLLNVGSADAVPHERLDGRWASGEAALLWIDGQRARFRLLGADDSASTTSF